MRQPILWVWEKKEGGDHDCYGQRRSAPHSRSQPLRSRRQGSSKRERVADPSFRTPRTFLKGEKMLYQNMLEREYRRVKDLPITRLVVKDGLDLVLLRTDLLSCGVKTAIGTCLTAYYIDQGLINADTKSVVIQGSGNTALGVKLAIDELSPWVKVVAVVYQETSDKAKSLLTREGIDVVTQTPRADGRVGREDMVKKLVSEEGVVAIEQHEQPLIVEIQARTLGTVLIEKLGKDVTHFLAGVGTGGTLFGIAEALRGENSALYVEAIEGLGSTLTLWHAYTLVRGKGYDAEKCSIEEALEKYRKAGMSTSLVCHPDRSSSNWFEIALDTPESAEVLGIEGLGVGDPTSLIMSKVGLLDEVSIVTNEQARTGMKMLLELGINACESAGANFFAARALGERIEEGKVLTVVTASG